MEPNTWRAYRREGVAISRTIIKEKSLATRGCMAVHQVPRTPISTCSAAPRVTKVGHSGAGPEVHPWFWLRVCFVNGPGGVLYSRITYT